MNINNINRSVPSSVREVFLGDIPFGSDYIMYTKEYSVDRTDEGTERLILLIFIKVHPG